MNTALDGLSYTPASDYNGSDTLSLTTNDQGNTGSGGAKSGADTVAITVNPVNDKPVANDFSVTTNEDTAATVDFSAHVFDVETTNANLTYTIVSGPSHGSMTGSGGPRPTPRP